MSNRRTGKSKRLRFKKITADNDLYNKGSENRLDNSDNNVNKMEHIETPTGMKKKRLRPKTETEEFGPKIDGYRFVKSIHDEPLNFEPKRPLFRPEPNTSQTSIFSDSSDAESENSPTPETRDQYDAYCKRWKVSNEIQWPVRDGMSIDVESVREFLICDAEKAEARRRLKQERVRWHPDKMMVGQPKELKEKVTHTFQCINSIWDSEFAKK